MVWVMVLLVQSIPYQAAVIMALVSAFSQLPFNLIKTMTAAPEPSKEEGAGSEGKTEAAGGGPA
jgi:hypothetical protein